MLKKKQLSKNNRFAKSILLLFISSCLVPSKTEKHNVKCILIAAIRFYCWQWREFRTLDVVFMCVDILRVWFLPTPSKPLASWLSIRITQHNKTSENASSLNLAAFPFSKIKFCINGSFQKHCSDLVFAFSVHKLSRFGNKRALLELSSTKGPPVHRWDFPPCGQNLGCWWQLCRRTPSITTGQTRTEEDCSVYATDGVKTENHPN